MKYFAIFAIFAGLSLYTNLIYQRCSRKKRQKRFGEILGRFQALLQAETYLPEMGAHGGEDTIHAIKILCGSGEGSRVIPN